MVAHCMRFAVMLGIIYRKMIPYPADSPIWFLKYTKDTDGKIIDGDCANWKISYGLSKSTSKLNNHLSLTDSFFMTLGL